jgi:hypothetical protein
LGKAEPSTTEQGRLAHARHATEEVLFERVLKWTRRTFGRRWLDPAMQALEGAIVPEMEEGTMLDPWLVYFYPLQGMPPARHFLNERGNPLTEYERATLECNLEAWLSMWEVRRVEPGVGSELFDLLSGETRFVHDVRSSRSLTRWITLLGSVVDYPEVSVLRGVHPRGLLPSEAASPLADTRRVLGVRTRKVPVARLRDHDILLHILRAWQMGVATEDMRSMAPRALSNTDGDPIVFCTDHFELAPNGRAEVFERLTTAIPGGHAEQPGCDDAIVFSRPGNKMHAHWDNTIVGRAWFERGRLLAETNSIKRADALRRQIEAAAGALLRFRAREVRDANAMPTEEAPERGESLTLLRTATPAPTRPPEVQAIMRKVLQQHYDSWPDARLPALGGCTPREAAASKKLRPKLIALLKDMECRDGMKPEADRFDFVRIWRALGLDPLQLGGSPIGRSGTHSET